MTEQNNSSTNKPGLRTVLVFWIILALPAVYIAYFLTGFFVSLNTMNALQESRAAGSPGVPESAFSGFALNQFIRPAYLDARDIYQGLRDCVELDDALIYKPRHDHPCRLNNLEFSTVFHHKNGIRWYKEKIEDSPSGKRILLLGDSHAMGWGVEGHETFAALLEKSLSLPVDNMGVSSYGLPRELMLLKQVLARQSYDLVILQYCDNDLREAEHYVEDGGISYDYRIPAQSSRTPDVLLQNFLVKLAVRIARFPVEGLEGPRLRDTINAEQVIAQVFSDFLEPESLPPIVAFTINNIREYATHNEFRYLRDAVSRLEPALARKIEVVDPLSELSEAERATHYFPIDGHLNQAGHRFLAGALQPSVESKIDSRQ